MNCPLTTITLSLQTSNCDSFTHIYSGRSILGSPDHDFDVNEKAIREGHELWLHNVSLENHSDWFNEYGKKIIKSGVVT